jgi:serine/threonine protein kinase/peptidoglycan hydrolase-like protein with peptidoglycan-binding domain
VQARDPTVPTASEPEVRGALPAGYRVQHYEIVSVLGQGGFGITYLARDTKLKRDVAIKEYLPVALALRDEGTLVLPRSTELSQDFLWGRERFLEEARTLATLGHVPAIVRVHDFLEANGTAYMVMGLAKGETLERRLKRDGRLPPRAVDRLLGPLLDGLQAVHAAGFLHRDIKPANIIVDADDNPTLVDFGASRAAMAGHSEAMTAIFTPGYAAAEQFTAARQGPWTDIYGASATIYHAVTGGSPPSAFERMIDDSYVPLGKLLPAGFGPGLLVGVDAGLAVRASDRPQTIAGWRPLLSATAMPSDDVTMAMARPPRVAAPPAIPAAPDDPPRPAAGRPRVALWAGVAAAMIALAGGGYLLLAPGSPSPPVTSRDRPPDDLATAQDRQRQADAAAAEQRRLQDDAQRKAESDAAAKAAADTELAKAQAERQQAERELTALKAEVEARRKAEADQRAQADAAAQRAADEAAQRRAEAELATARQAEADAQQRAATEAEAQRQSDAARAKAQAERQRADDEAAAAKRKAAEEAATAKPDAEAVENALRLELADRRRLQVALTSLGFDTHGNDGVFGPRSREMISAWQKSRSEGVTGFLTGPQQRTLMQDARGALAKFEAEQASKPSAAATAPATPASPPSSDAMLEQKKFTLPNRNGVGCNPSSTYTIRIYPRKVVLQIANDWRTLEANAAGDFGGSFQSGTSAAKLTVSGNLPARTISVVNLASNGCTWSGSF